MDFFEFLDGLGEFFTLEESHGDGAFGFEGFLVGVAEYFLQELVAGREGLYLLVKLAIGLVVSGEGLIEICDFLLVLVVDGGHYVDGSFDLIDSFD